MVIWDKNRDGVLLCRDGMRETIVKIELNLARDTKNYKRFYRYVNQKRKVKEGATAS